MARLDTLKYRTLRAAALLVGQLWLQTSEMKNVPCCAQHKEAVSSPSAAAASST